MVENYYLFHSKNGEMTIEDSPLIECEVFEQTDLFGYLIGTSYDYLDEKNILALDIFNLIQYFNTFKIDLEQLEAFILLHIVFYQHYKCDSLRYRDYNHIGLIKLVR